MRKQTIKPAVFDGTNNLFSSAGVFAPPNKGFTFLATINANSLSAAANILGIRSAGYIRVSASAIFTSFKGETVSASTPLVADMNYNICLSVSDVDMKLRLYLDGVMVAESSDIADLSSVELTSMRIGSEWDGNRLFDGNISNVAFFSRGLSSDEVKRIHNNSLTVSPASFKRLGITDEITAIYSLDSENEVIDLSGNDLHLSNINNVTFDGSPVDTLHTGLQTQNTLKADGTQYLTGAKISEVGEDFFFSCFAKFDDLAYLIEQYIFDERSKVYIRTRNFGAQTVVNFRSSVASHTITIQDILQNGKLYHFAISVDSVALTFSVYFDGVLVDFVPIADTNKANSFTRIYTNSFSSNQLKGSLHNIYFGRKAFGQTGVDWFYNKGVPRDLSIMPSKYANEALSIYEPTLLNGGADISGNGNDCSIVGTPAYTATEEVQKISNYQTGL